MTKNYCECCGSRLTVEKKVDSSKEEDKGRVEASTSETECLMKALEELEQFFALNNKQKQ